VYGVYSMAKGSYRFETDVKTLLYYTKVRAVDIEEHFAHPRRPDTDAERDKRRNVPMDRWNTLLTSSIKYMPISASCAFTFPGDSDVTYSRL
jgi:hypothetical protein